MKRLMLALVLCCVVLAFARAEVATKTVPVVDSGGVAIKDAGTTCLDAACTKLRCYAAGFVAMEVTYSPDAVCRLTPAASLRGFVDAACGGECSVTIWRRGGASPIATADVVAPTAPETRARFSVDGLQPGRLSLEVRRNSDGWSCRTPLGVVKSGPATVPAGWHAPVAVQGRVVAEKEAPVPAIPVRLWARARGAHAGGNAPEPIGVAVCGPSNLETVTDSKGEFAFAAVDSSSELLVVAGGWDDKRGIGLALPKALDEPLTLTLEQPAFATARVLDRGDRPALCKARLESYEPGDMWLMEALKGSRYEAECDSKGVLKFGPMIGRGLYLEIRPKNAVILNLHQQAVPPGKHTDLGTFRLTPGDEVVVRVVDPDDRPVAKAKACARGENALILTRCEETDESGKAILGGLPLHSSITATAQAPGYALARSERLTAKSSPITLKLRPGVTLKGSVVDPWGKGVAGAVVELRGADQEEWEDSSTTSSDENGKFTFESLDQGQFSLTAKARGFAPSKPASITLAKLERVPEPELQLLEAPALRGHVLDPAGLPVAGARVVVASMMGSTSDTLEQQRLVETSTDAAGAFALARPSSQWSRVVAVAQGFPAVSKLVRDFADGEDNVLQFGAPATVVVRDLTQSGRTTHVTLHDSSHTARNLPTDKLKPVVFEDVPAGDAEVWGSDARGGTTSETSSLELKAGETAEVTLEDNFGSIEGTLTLDGAPWSMGVLSAWNIDSFDGYWDTTSDGAGAYQFQPAKPGRWVVVATAAGAHMSRRVEVRAHETTRVDFDLIPIVVRVTVRDRPGGAPLKDASVSLLRLQAPRECISAGGASIDLGDYETLTNYEVCGDSTGLTGADGQVLLQPSEPGEYWLSASTSSRIELPTRRVSVKRGENTFELARDPKDQPPRIVATLPEGTTLRKAICVHDGLDARAVPGEDRTVVCDGVVQGRWWVIASTTDGRGGVTQVDVPDHGDAAATLQLSSRAVLQVVDPDGSTVVPFVADDRGITWLPLLRYFDGSVDCDGRPGKCFVFRGVPPGTYRLTRIDGSVASVTLPDEGTATLE